MKLYIYTYIRKKKLHTYRSTVHTMLEREYIVIETILPTINKKKKIIIIKKKKGVLCIEETL